MNIAIEILAMDPWDRTQKSLVFVGNSDTISLESRWFVGQHRRVEQECPEYPVFDRKAIKKYVSDHGRAWLYGKKECSFLGFGKPVEPPPFPLGIFNSYGNQKSTCQGHMILSMLNILDGFRINRDFDHIMACAEVLEGSIPRLFGDLRHPLWFLSNYETLPIQEILDLVYSGHLWSVSFEQDLPRRRRIDRVFVPFLPPVDDLFPQETRNSSKEYWQQVIDLTRRRW